MKKVEGDRYLALTSDPHMSMDVKYTCTHMCTYMYFSWTPAYTNISSVFLTDLQRMSFPTPCTYLAIASRDEPSAGSGRTGKNS